MTQIVTETKYTLKIYVCGENLWKQFFCLNAEAAPGFPRGGALTPKGERQPFI